MSVQELPDWMCKNCTSLNLAIVDKCHSCGFARPESVRIAHDSITSMVAQQEIMERMAKDATEQIKQLLIQMYQFGYTQGLYDLRCAIPNNNCTYAGVLECATKLAESVVQCPNEDA